MQLMKTKTRKRRLALFVALIMALTLWTAMPLTASADEKDGDVYTDAEGFKYTVSGSEATITGYAGSKTEIDIPAAVAGDGETATIPVTAIGANAFGTSAAPNTTLKTIAIPDSVTTIHVDAFNAARALTAITVDSQNQEFSGEGGVLFDRNKTTLVRYPEGRIGEYTIPDGVITIGSKAFGDCGWLTKVTIPVSVVTIESMAFIHDSGITELTIPSGVKTIGSWAFSSCNTLASVTIPANVETIGGTAFGYNNALTSVTIQNGVKTIGVGAFMNCPLLTSVTIPGSVTSIGENAFANATKLSELTISEGTNPTTIGVSAFQNCKSLTSVTIPSNVTSLGQGAFDNCPLLATVNGMSGVESIGQYAFRNNSSLTAVTIPSTVTAMGNNVFQNCVSLTSVTIENGAKVIGGNAFLDCTSLTAVEIPASVTTLNVNAFGGCKALTAITVNSENQNFSDNQDGVLYNKGKTELLRYPEGKAGAFSSWPNTVTTIGVNAFSGCTSLTSVTIPDTVTSIGTSAFRDCTALTSVTLSKSSSFTTIGGNVFYGCASLAAITIPANITTIAINVFNNCSALTDIVVQGASTNLNTLNPDATFTGTTLSKVWIRSTMANNNLKQYANSRKIIGYFLNSISLTNTPSTLNVGASQTLGVGYLPADTATTTTEPRVVTWGSSDDNIATVDENGTVTGVSSGTATITATATSLSGQTIPPATCSVTVSSADNSITSFKIGDYEGVITDDAASPTTKGTIAVTVPYGTNITNVTPTIAKSNGATVSDEAASQTFTSLVDYTVTPSAGSAKTYTVTVTVLPAPKDITAFTLAGVAGIITDDKDTPATKGDISVTLPAGTEITSLTPQITKSNEATVSDETASKNFGDADPVTYTVTGADGETKVYTVHVTVTPSSAKDITTFRLAETDCAINGNVITVTLPYGTNVNGVAPNEVTFSESASIAPLATATQNFNNNVKYTVTAADGSKKAYTVVVKFTPPLTGREITSFAIGGAAGNITGNDISVTVPYGTNVTALEPVVAVSEKAAVSPASEAATDFTDPVIYTVTAQSGARQYYTVTVTPAPVTPPPATNTFAVTVVNGTGSASYAENAAVNITANAPASGKVFDTWTTTDGVTFANANSASTSFVMPAKAVTVTATYKDETVNPPEPPVADNGWVYASGTWKFFKDGEAATGWIHDGTAWYYLNASGIMQTGWIHDGKAWYYLAGNGAMKTGWVKDNGSWYYLSGNGAMVAAKWFHDTDGSWYYLSGNGKMLTGKQNIGGKAYTFKANGVWVS